MEILKWEKEQALWYYEHYLEAVGDVAVRKGVQADAFLRTARTALGVPFDALLDSPVSWNELPPNQLPEVVGLWLKAESHRGHGFILGRKAEALRKLWSDAKTKFEQIKSL